MNLAIIPARGGSKRIPRKNVKLFAGKPIIAYSIEAAAASGLFDSIIVSTDDTEIADVAKSYGAGIPFMRPKTLSDDHTGTTPVVKHAINWFIERNTHVSCACCIYATAPFIQPAHLIEGYQRLRSSGKSYVFSVTSFAYPIQRAIRIAADGTVDPIYPENILVRSQDLEEAYHDAGQFYFGTADSWMNDVVAFSSASLPIVLPRYLVQDIDTPEDWKRAELMYRAWQESLQPRK